MTNSPKSRLALLEQFLREHEKSNKRFTKDEIAKFTKYNIQTISTYFAKYLLNYLVFQQPDKTFISAGINKLSSTEFFSHLSQKSAKLEDSKVDPKVRKLRQRSLDAFCIAVENYNRITLPNRIEVFCILMANAWELLLKSVLLNQHGIGSIYYSSSDRTITLKDAAEKCFKENDPIRKNIEELAELRDQSIHLLIEELHAPLSRVFQASVLNYNDFYQKEVGKPALPKNTIGILSLVCDFLDLENQIHLKDDNISPEKIQVFLENFSSREAELKSEQYAIDIKRKLVLTKKESDADIKLSNNSNAQEAIIIERHRPRKDTHPFRQNDAINEINIKLNTKSLQINSYNFQALLSKHKIKKNHEYYADGDFGTSGSYSQRLIDKFIEMINSNPQCVEEANQHLRTLRQRAKTKQKS